MIRQGSLCISEDDTTVEMEFPSVAMEMTVCEFKENVSVKES